MVSCHCCLILGTYSLTSCPPKTSPFVSLTCLNAGPPATISWMTSSTQMMPCAPRAVSTTALSVRGTRSLPLPTLPAPRLYTSSRTVLTEG